MKGVFAVRDASGATKLFGNSNNAARELAGKVTVPEWQRTEDMKPVERLIADILRDDVREGDGEVQIDDYAISFITVADADDTGGGQPGKKRGRKPKVVTPDAEAGEG